MDIKFFGILFCFIYIFSGCSFLLKTDKPFKIDNISITKEQFQKMEDEKMIESFTDNRGYIFKALIDMPCFFEIDSIVWYQWLKTYNNDDIDGFVKWVTDGELYHVSGGQSLSNYFKQVKLYYQMLKNEKQNP